MAYIIKTSRACMPSTCKFGTYMRVAVLEVEPGVERVKMISERARGVRQIVRLWDRVNVGKTERGAFQRALRDAKEMVSQLETAGVQS